MIVGVQGPDGRCQINLDADKTIRDLQVEIMAKTGIPPKRQKILVGFPPQEALKHFLNTDTPLSAAGVEGGTLLRVSEVAEEELPPTRKFARKVIPADNSCLFNCIAYCMSPVENIHQTNSAQELRELVSAVILSDPDEYCENLTSVRSTSDPAMCRRSRTVQVQRGVQPLDPAAVELGRSDRVQHSVGSSAG